MGQTQGISWLTNTLHICIEMSHQFLINTYNSSTQKIKTTNETKSFLKADISHLLQFSLVHGGTGAGWWRALWIHRAAAATVGFFDHLWEWDTVWGPKWWTESCVGRQRPTVWQGNWRVQQHLVFVHWFTHLLPKSPVQSWHDTNWEMAGKYTPGSLWKAPPTALRCRHKQWGSKVRCWKGPQHLRICTAPEEELGLGSCICQVTHNYL